MRTKGLFLGCIALVAMLVVSTPVMAADDVADMKEMVKSLQARIEKMEQNDAQSVQKEDMARMMKDILAEAQTESAMPSWMENLTFFGDFTLRGVIKKARGNRNGTLATGILPLRKFTTDETRKYMEVRVRFGFIKTWWDNQLSVKFGLSTVNAFAQGGTRNYGNDILGGPRDNYAVMGDGFRKKGIMIDTAYVKYQPKFLPGMTIIAGKMDNQIKTRTFMTWDEDITPEGIYNSYVMPFFGEVKPYVEFGYYMLQADTWYDFGQDIDAVNMWHIGAGVDWAIQEDMNLFFGMTYYGFDNSDELIGSGALMGGTDMQWANGPRYGIVEVTSKFDWKMLDLPWQVFASWVHNCQDDYGPNGTADRSNRNMSDAFAIGMTVGQNKKKGDWSAGYTYAYIEDRAVMGILTDFYFGGPNQKGHILRGAYNIDDFLVVGASVYLTEAVHSYQYIPSGGGNCSAVLDVTWSF